jgi:hypothetical protein
VKTWGRRIWYGMFIRGLASGVNGWVVRGDISLLLVTFRGHVVARLREMGFQ